MIPRLTWKISESRAKVRKFSVAPPQKFEVRATIFDPLSSIGPTPLAIDQPHSSIPFLPETKSQRRRRDAPRRPAERPQPSHPPAPSRLPNPVPLLPQCRTIPRAAMKP
jgi:hypothetical protein